MVNKCCFSLPLLLSDRLHAVLAPGWARSQVPVTLSVAAIAWVQTVAHSTSPRGEAGQAPAGGPLAVRPSLSPEPLLLPSPTGTVTGPPAIRRLHPEPTPGTPHRQLRQTQPASSACLPQTSGLLPCNNGAPFLQVCCCPVPPTQGHPPGYPAREGRHAGLSPDPPMRPPSHLPLFPPPPPIPPATRQPQLGNQLLFSLIPPRTSHATGPVTFQTANRSTTLSYKNPIVAHEG